MRFVSVAERELRAAVRRPGLYRLRWLTAAAFTVLLLWLSWVYDLFQNGRAGQEVLQAFTVVAFVYCLLVGATTTADCLSREKREGTLGLLFLTNLNSAEIVAGKWCANALATLYSSLAIFPVLALPVLVGGITLGYFWRTVLALVNALLFAIAAGFVASAVSVRQFPAIALAAALSLVMGMALLGAAEAMRRLGAPSAVTEVVASFCPLHTLLAANDSVRAFSRPRFWLSLALVGGVSWTWLALVAWWLGRAWRDRPRGPRWRAWAASSERFRVRSRASRAALRRRLLAINPFFWLASRQRVSAPVFMALTVVLVCVTVTVTTPLFSRMLGIGVGPANRLVGQIFAWFWTGLVLHAIVLYYGATVAAQRVAEDKQTGALELILSTPTTERTISRGLWLAYGRRMFFPVLAAVLVHIFFLWVCATVFVCEPSFRAFRAPSAVTPGVLLWHLLLNQPIPGARLPWEMGFMLRMAFLALGVLATTWVAAGWVGRWLGLRMKHPGFAPLATVALVVAPPVLLFSLLCYVGNEVGMTRMSERQLLPILQWVGFSIGVGHCLLLCTWAATRLRLDFRTTVTSRFQPPQPRPRWRPHSRFMLRFAAWAAGLTLALVALGLLVYAYQDHRSRRRWAAFQQQLTQRGESLSLSPLLPGPVAPDQNFAQTTDFIRFADRGLADPSANALLDRLARTAVAVPGGGNPKDALTAWIQQGFAEADAQLAWILPNFQPAASQDRTNAAAAVLDGLQPLDAVLAALAAAANRPAFQVTTNRGADAVYVSNLKGLTALEQLHYLFQVRACTQLALDRPDAAAADVLTGLRIAQLARQSPDMKSTLRTQALLARSLQPIWEGIVDHRWREPQLAAFQVELTRFNLLADHTNAIRRAVLAHIASWREVPETPAAAPGGVRGRASAWQPRAAWYDNCIQLYEAGQNALARVDLAAGRVSGEMSWEDLRDLPLADGASDLFQQGPWWGDSPVLVSFAQTALNQAVVACALERYRLAKGRYPESLGPLQPAYLARVPPDVMRGQPLAYERVDPDAFTIRGAGANGSIGPAQKTSDDWLWSFPAEPEVKP